MHVSGRPENARTVRSPKDRNRPSLRFARDGREVKMPTSLACLSVQRRQAQAVDLNDLPASERIELEIPSGLGDRMTHQNVRFLPSQRRDPTEPYIPGTLHRTSPATNGGTALLVPMVPSIIPLPILVGDIEPSIPTLRRPIALIRSTDSSWTGSRL